MIERIFCGAVTRGSAQKEGRMSYTEFVWFLLSEEVETSFLLLFATCVTVYKPFPRTSDTQLRSNTGSVAWTLMEMDFSPCEDKSPKVRFLEIFLLRYELEYFYEEQLQRMEQLGIETLPFDDCLCQVLPSLSFLCFQSHIILSPQMLDMIRPLNKHAITLKDLKQCKMTPVFFDTFFNLEKYLDHEQRDPFATQRETDEDGNEVKIQKYCVLRKL